MNWVGIVLFAVIVTIGTLLVLCCITPTKVHVRYKRKSNDDHLSIQLQLLFGLIKYKIVIPNIDLVIGHNQQLHIKAKSKRGIGEPKHKSSLRSMFTEVVSSLHKIQRQLFQQQHILAKLRTVSKVFQVVKFTWSTRLGVADAAVTATAAGAIWALKGALLAVLTHFLSFRQSPDIEVAPIFHADAFETNVDCIIRFWLGQAILAAVKLGLYLLREGNKPWQIIRYRV